MKKKIQKTENSKQEFQTLIQTTTIQGFPKIFSSKNKGLKFIWFILTMVSTCACGYFSVNSTLEYLDFKVITEIQTIRDESAEFPTVSFCHNNNTNFSFEVLSLKFNAEDMKKRWKKYMESFIDKRFGKCFRFNSGKNMTGDKTDILRTYVPGTDYGLKLDLKIPPGNTNYAEIKVFVHNSSFVPATLDSYGMIITTGSWSTFKLQLTYDSKLEEPYNRCLKDINKFDKNRTLIEYIDNKNITYSQQECFRLCQNMKYLELYSHYCKLDSLYDSLLLICYKNIKNEAIRNVTIQFINLFHSNEFYEECENYCPLECDSVDLYIDYGSNAIAGGLDTSAKGFTYPDFVTYYNISRSFLSIRVYYNELKYTFINQSPKMQFFDLLSNIGGIFGLFLGMSFLSFVELFEIILQLIISMIRKIKF